MFYFFQKRMTPFMDIFVETVSKPWASGWVIPLGSSLLTTEGRCQLEMSASAVVSRSCTAELVPVIFI